MILVSNRISIFILSVSFILLSSFSLSQTQTPPRFVGHGPQIVPPPGYTPDIGPVKQENSFQSDDPGSIVLGTIKIPEGAIYELNDTGVYIRYHKDGSSVQNGISKVPTLRNLMRNNLLEFLPTDNLFPSAQLKLEVTPQTTNISFKTVNDTGYGSISILNVLKLIQLLEKSFFRAYKTNYWKPNEYVFINGHPITITINISIESGEVHIDSVILGFFSVYPSVGSQVQFQKPATEAYSNKVLSDQEVLIEYPIYPSTTSS